MHFIVLSIDGNDTPLITQIIIQCQMFTVPGFCKYPASSGLTIFTPLSPIRIQSNDLWNTNKLVNLIF